MDLPAITTANAAAQATETVTVHLAIVLDRSGSMEECRAATIDGFNGYLKEMRAEARESKGKTTATLVAFSDEAEALHFMEGIEAIDPLTYASYVPNGSTALLDAMGETIDRLERATGPKTEDHFIVCVISDGYENASHRCSPQEIATTISRLTERGNWTFTYLGANQDLGHVSAEMNIPSGNVAPYAASPAGTQEAWDRHARSTSARVRAMRSGSPVPDAFYASEDEPENDGT